MNKIGGGGLMVAAVALLVAGLFLRWDLIDWLIDTVGLLFIIGGAGVGIAALIKILSGRGAGERAH
jgi:hypothetical protein